VVVGGGLAGSEAAWALAERGVQVTLHEMRPLVGTPAHQTDGLAELVCSNSFKSTELVTPHGLLKAEMRRLGSIVLQAADAARVPGGAALAVDRVAFSAAVQERVVGHPNITLVRGEVTALPSPGVVATGPLTSAALSEGWRSTTPSRRSWRTSRSITRGSTARRATARAGATTISTRR
jgi:methylenetetrahydrofolate--tRNA-(uracil-5-)-methyltransferase